MNLSELCNGRKKVVTGVEYRKLYTITFYPPKFKRDPIGSFNFPRLSSSLFIANKREIGAQSPANQTLDGLPTSVSNQAKPQPNSFYKGLASSKSCTIGL